MVSKTRLFFGVLALAVMAGACDIVKNSNAPSGPGPTQPGIEHEFPSGVPVITETISGQMGPDSPATCEPILDSRICDAVTFTAQSDGMLQYIFTWSPAEAGAANQFLVGEGPEMFIELAPSGMFEGLIVPTVKGQTRKVSAYLLLKGHGKSNYKLEVKHNP